MTAQPVSQTRIIAEAARLIAEGFVADNLGDQIGTGTPRRVVSSLRSAWVVPLLLSAPGYGVVGSVGFVMVDEELGYLNAWTPLEEIQANVDRVAHEQQAEIEAAFVQARRQTQE